MVIYSVLPEVMNHVPLGLRPVGGPLNFGIVGRLAPWKGQEAFLRAFPTDEERATVVGAALFGEDEFAGGLTRLASSLGIGDRVDLRGHGTDVWDELSRIDVLVHASVTPEWFGQVILEGWQPVSQ